MGDLVLAGAISALLVQYVHMPIGAALILAGLYLISPALTLVNIGPRSFHLTPRLPSQLLYGAVVAIIIAEQGRPSPVALAAVVVLLAAMLLDLEVLASGPGVQHAGADDQRGSARHARLRGRGVPACGGRLAWLLRASGRRPAGAPGVVCEATATAHGEDPFMAGSRPHAQRETSGVQSRSSSSRIR